MSLLVWLPLNGNTTNQGVDGITLSGSPASYSAGKIGTAATWNGSVSNVVYNNTTAYNYTDNFSFALWIYPIYTGSTAQYVFTVGRADAGGYGYGLQVASATQVSVRFGNKVITVTCNSNAWSHIAMTVKNSTINVYVNGALASSQAVGSLPTYSDGNGLGIGCFHYSGNIYPYYGRINDFRIYDHALSAKEIKEISKGLVVHYPLTMNGIGNDNIVPGTSPYEVTYTYPSSSFSDKWASTSSIVPSASQYTLSFYAKSTVNGDKARAHWYNPNTTTRCETNQGTVSTAGDGNIDFTLSTEWKKYWCVYTQSSTTAVKHLIFPRLFYGSGSGTVSVKCVKLEEGSAPTAWKPNSGDTLYTTLKYNDTTEVDISGYKYHGIKSGVTYESNSPKYDVSTIFDANDNTITLPAIQTSGTTIPQISVSIQFKTNTLNSTTPNLQSLGENNFARIRLASATSIQYYIKVASTKVSSTYTTKTLTDNVQHQAVFTFNNGIATMYIDGVQVGTTNHSSAGTSLTMSSTSQHLAGYSANGENFLGNLSDFRIYATALSADDIKELYQTSISIADNGTVMSYEFNEE